MARGVWDDALLREPCPGGSPVLVTCGQAIAYLLDTRTGDAWRSGAVPPSWVAPRAALPRETHDHRGATGRPTVLTSNPRARCLTRVRKRGSRTTDLAVRVR